jgi:hypothetical protein
VIRERTVRNGVGMGMHRHGRGYTNSEIYNPDLIRALQAVFDDAWQEISATHCALEHADATRNDLAQMIILAHKCGLEPDEIKLAILGKAARVGSRLKAATEL